MNSDDVKKRVEAAMLKHHKKQLPKQQSGPRDNPEQRMVHELLKHMRKLGFTVDIVDSSTFDRQAGYHTQSVTRPGFSDIVGNSVDGVCIYIEAKAPGKRNTLRPAQREFLLEKINTNTFAVVCDSIQSFDVQWSSFMISVDRKRYLLDQMPAMTANEKRRDDSNLSFDD